MSNQPRSGSERPEQAGQQKPGQQKPTEEKAGQQRFAEDRQKADRAAQPGRQAMDSPDARDLARTQRESQKDIKK